MTGPVALSTQGVLAAARNPIVRWEWVADRPGELWARTLDHLQLTVTAVVVGLVNLIF